MYNRPRAKKKPQPKRRAQINRENGVRSRYKRCPKCKKLRMYWLPANWWKNGRRVWGQREGQLVCYICIQREEKIMCKNLRICTGLRRHV